MTKQMQVLHLGREIKTSLELAIAAGAPSDLVDRLATAAGLLDAIVSLGLERDAGLPLVGTTCTRATDALTDWQRWRDDNPSKARA